ncbi:MAG: valine--tRNA ligase, partial [Planctomycetaceae bacterium]|nr:valine--tRNA ligase [Planctomycetaceae bacterium]
MALSFSLPPRFEPGTIESKWYDAWMAQDVFRAERDIKKKPYTIMMPPPNVTGVLHLGHALQDTLMDALTRVKRMQGFNALWLPGTDHAGIATQAVVEKKIFAEEKLTREDMGREKFLERVWQWKEEHGNTILNQLRGLGAGCDWSRTRFTLDEGLSRAVREAFVRMYDKGLIYRGARIVNWDCTLRTAVSDDEIEMIPEKGMLAFIKYPIKDQPGKFIEVATTRPETMFGDTAVAVHPGDERYSELIGQSVLLPLIHREIPVIADDTVDPKFGTGAVKVTPGHDPADFARGQKANLPTLIVLNQDGTLNELAGFEYNGLDRFKARKKVLADLESQGLLVRVEEHEHNVPQSDRSKTIIEPLVSEQWFVKMREIVGPALEAYQNEELKFYPERWGRIYETWLRNVEDWCISRQLWWGHRIPVYYDEDNTPAASVDPITVHPKTGKKIVRQDDDVLDTWFSSALWPFSTLGWPDQTADLDYYYPTDVLVTDRGIIYLWVARMVIQGYLLTGKKPFGDVFIHATVLDEYGKRMSKSVGNGIDPLDMIRMYGVDSFRFS